jgi:transposase
LNNIAELEATLKKREQQLFGRKTEKSGKSRDQKKPEESKRNRGQQYGRKGHSRREYKNLPRKEEEIDLAEEDKCCCVCGLPYQKLSDTEDSEVVEITNVKAHIRYIKRKKYRRCCQCDNHAPQIVMAPSVPKLIGKSTIGISVWVFILINKYEYKQPQNRSLEELMNAGLSLAPGTITDGMQKLVPLFAPIYTAIVQHGLMDKHWHADETGWKVFEKIENKNNSNWYLWVFCNSETTVFKVAPNRSSKIIKEHFGENHKGGTLSVDRYSAYKAIAKDNSFILAFCWAHVRRDFLSYSKGYPEHEEWGLSWIENIANLYHINKLRCEHEQNSKIFHKYHGQLKHAIGDMRKRLDKELDNYNTPCMAKKILKSLDKHWDGLTVFVNHSEIPMDNNIAERTLRTSVVGRKNYYGSHAIWSAQLAAYLFTIFGTLKLWEINPQTWLTAYLQACAHSGGGKVPGNIDIFLPWCMTEEQKSIFKSPLSNQLTLPLTVSPTIINTG